MTVFLAVLLIILKVLGYILLGLLGLILLLLIMPIGVAAKYSNGDISFKAKIFFVTVYKFPKAAKPKKRRKASPKADAAKISLKKEASADSAARTENAVQAEKKETVKSSAVKSEPEVSKKEKKKSDGGGISEKISFYLEIWEACNKYIKRLFKSFALKIYVDIKVSDEDAYDCALKYGRTCIAVYNGTSLLDKIFTVKAEKIGVRCIFDEPESTYEIGVKVKLRLINAVTAGLGMLFTYLKINKKKEKLKEVRI